MTSINFDMKQLKRKAPQTGQRDLESRGFEILGRAGHYNYREINAICID